MRHTLGATLFLAAGILSGQTTSATASAHSGWSFDDTLQSATDIVVADIIRGGGHDNGSQVSATAEVRVVRVLQGGLAPGAGLTLVWAYPPMPFESPAAAARMPAARALWFLRKRPEGGFEPFRAGEPFSSFGGFFLEVPSATPAYPPDPDVQTKLAVEIGAALEDLAARRGADLAPHEPVRPGAAIPEWVRTRNRFMSLTMTLDRLDKKASAQVYRRFSASGDTTLKIVGLWGRVAGGDADAFCDMEPNLATLVTAYSPTPLIHGAIVAEPARNLRAAHCLARMALAEVTLPALECAAAFQLGWMKTPDFLPYLVALLASPNPSTRAAALASVCRVIEPPPEMSAHCPRGAPVGDPQKEQEDIDYWKQWWAANREKIGKTVSLPDVVPPARFAAAPQPSPTRTEIPIEIRLQMVLNQAGAQATHYHTATGEIVNEQPPSYDPVAPKLSDQDRDAWREIVDRTNSKLAANDQRSRALMNAGRVEGVLPPQGKMGALYQERLAILRAALEQLQSRLSPDGWQALLASLPAASAGGMIQAAPPPPR